MLDPRAVAPGLERRDDGLWWPRVLSPVDYPDEGNAFCFEVEDRSFWFRHRNGCILDAVRRLPPAGPLFDIGGGNGFVSRALIAAGVSAVVVEPGPVGAANAARRGIPTVICATLEDAAFEPGSLPSAGLFDVLEHMPDDRQVLRTLHTCLAPGGRLYLSVPAYEWLWSADDDLGGHHRRYTLRQLRRVLTSAGFAVEYLSCFFAPLPLPVLLLRSLPWRLGSRPEVDPDALRQQLAPSPSVAERVLVRVLDSERRWLADGRRLPVGGSCLAVARRA